MVIHVSSYIPMRCGPVDVVADQAPSSLGKLELIVVDVDRRLTPDSPPTMTDGESTWTPTNVSLYLSMTGGVIFDVEVLVTLASWQMLRWFTVTQCYPWASLSAIDCVLGEATEWRCLDETPDNRELLRFANGILVDAIGL